MKNKTLNTYLTRLCLCALLASSALFSYSQKIDTIKCIILFCDTARNYYAHEYYTLDTCLSDTIPFNCRGHIEKDTTWYSPSFIVQWMKGYSVGEWHNTAENSIDPGGSICMDKMGKIIDCWHDYRVHKYYLDTNKKPLKKSFIVWQSH